MKKIICAATTTLKRESMTPLVILQDETVICRAPDSEGWVLPGKH